MEYKVNFLTSTSRELNRRFETIQKLALKKGFKWINGDNCYADIVSKESFALDFDTKTMLLSHREAYRIAYEDAIRKLNLEEDVVTDTPKPKFKIGDKVKFLKQSEISGYSSSLSIGKIYTIVQTQPWYSFDETNITLYDLGNGHNQWVIDEQIEKVEDFRFKVGDTVRLIANAYRSIREIGYVDKVTEVFVNSSGQKLYRVGEGMGNWSLETDLELAFKIGDWVTDDDGENVYKIGEIADGRYYPSKFSWYTTDNGTPVDSSITFGTRLRLATETEIMNCLLTEANRRGFVVGATYTPTSEYISYSYNVLYTPKRWQSSSKPKYNLEVGKGQGLIYDDEADKWAAVIRPTQRTVVTTIAGFDVITKDSNIYHIGCKSVTKQEINTFLDICNRFAIKYVTSEFTPSSEDKGQLIPVSDIHKIL